MKADEFLQQGIDAMKQRAALRDTPEGERSTAKAVEIFNAWTGHKLSEADGWRFMIALKQAREIQGQFHADDYVDMAAYPGLLGECLARDGLAPRVFGNKWPAEPLVGTPEGMDQEGLTPFSIPGTPSGPACGVETRDLGKVFDRTLSASLKPVPDHSDAVCKEVNRGAEVICDAMGDWINGGGRFGPAPQSPGGPAAVFPQPLSDPSFQSIGKKSLI